MTPAMLAILQGLIAAIPTAPALLSAILAFRNANPGMSQAQTDQFTAAMTSMIANVGADELATLALIPPVPPKA